MDKRSFPALICLLFLSLSAGVFSLRAAPLIVEGGRARAEIVIAPQAPGMVKLAARELCEYLEKITGAQLPVVTEPGGAYPVKIFVGRSAHTDRLGIGNEDLDYGAFRMVSGASHLVLLGRDNPFVPRGPWTVHRGDNPDRQRMWQEWDELSGGKWHNPVGGGLATRFNDRLLGERLWEGDERGSLNAVHEFLHNLGVRWYMPGDLGEVVPRLDSVPLPAVDRLVRPDFAMRRMLFARFRQAPHDDLLWTLRLGLNHDEVTGSHIGHGLRDVTVRDEMKAAHPDYYALYGNRRDTAGNRSCLSSEGLFEETVRFARALFNIYGLPMVSVMPEDGYQTCGCELCRGKDTPERGDRGRHSDYVWAFVDRVAREIYRTHPDRKIICFSYGGYTLAPEKIKKLSPNVVVGLVHARGWFFPGNPAVYQARGLDKDVMEVRREWLEKTDNPLVAWEHYPFTHRGTFLPVYFPRAIAAGLRSLKGVSAGEFIEVAADPQRGGGLHAPGFNHLNLYVTARLYWDADQDLDALLNEYYELFYGPAAPEMKAFVEYCEAAWPEMNNSAEKIDRALALLADARHRAAPDSVHGRRLALLGEYLPALTQRRAQLAETRKDAPLVTMPWHRGPAGITLDGRLDEPAWQAAGAHRLRDLVTGGEPAADTTFYLFWSGDRLAGTLNIGIRCAESDMANLAVFAQPGDPPALPGDCLLIEDENIEILLETGANAYYQVVVNPDGAVFDLDRRGGGAHDWSAQAQVATHRGADFWSIEISLPVTGDDMPADPLHRVAGRRPTASLPWHFNLGRRRTRGDRVELTAFAPTGEPDLHLPRRFARLETR